MKNRERSGGIDDKSNLLAKKEKEGNICYIDVTNSIPDGERLAEEAVEAAGGAINISGWYPPSEEIMIEIKKLLNDKDK